MQGGTHLAFGTAVSVAAVGLGGIGIGATVIRHHISLPAQIAPATTLTIVDLHPTAWLALVLAGGLGSLLPDIDQPGSLVTRMPARQGRALQRMAQPYGRGALGTPARFTGSTLAAGGGLASALLGAPVGGSSRAGRFMLL